MGKVVDLEAQKRKRRRSAATEKKPSPAKRTRRTRKPQPFTRRHFQEWAKAMVLDNEEQWEVEEYFLDFAEDIFAGYRVCWLVVPEENAKTTSTAGLCLYIIEHKRNIKIPWAASSRDQAEIGYTQMELFVINSEIEDDTRSTAKRTTTPHVFRCLEGYRRVRHDATNSRVQIFAADERGGDGIIPGGLCVIDELHRHRGLGLYRTWMGKLRKRNAQLVVTSTAGEVGGEFERERASIHEKATGRKKRGRCFTRAEKIGETGTKLQVLHDWSIPVKADPYDLELVAEANPFSQIDVEVIREKHDLSTDHLHWLRVVCNRAARVANAAITQEEWENARTTRTIPEGVPIWAGLDVAWKHDCTALVGYWPESEKFKLLGQEKILTPPRDGSMLPTEDIEDALTELHDRNPIHTLVMDMSMAAPIAQWASTTLGCLVIDRQQNNALAAEDYNHFMEGIRDGWLFHEGGAEMTSHVMNAVARQLPKGDTRFERPVSNRANAKEQERRVIDALTASGFVVTAEATEEVEERGGTAFAFA